MLLDLLWVAIVPWGDSEVGWFSLSSGGHSIFGGVPESRLLLGE